MADGFEIRLNGQVIHTVNIDPRQVVGASVRTAAGKLRLPV
jgi:hypothetical protein